MKCELVFLAVGALTFGACAGKAETKWVSIFNQDSTNFLMTHGDEKMNAAGIRECLDGVVIVREGLSPEAIRGKAKEFPQGWIYEP